MNKILVLIIMLFVGALLIGMTLVISCIMNNTTDLQYKNK